MSTILARLAALAALAAAALLGGRAARRWLSTALDDAFDFDCDPPAGRAYTTGGYLPAGHAITVNRHPDEQVFSAAQVRLFGLGLFGDPRGETA